MEAGEWEGASALSGFWYDYTRAQFLYLAPIETQLQVYAMYDDDYLYIAYTSPVYPEGSWLRSRGRFPNVLHGRYGVHNDDKLELELRPYHDMARGFQLGLMKWNINSIDTVVDSYWSPTKGMNTKWDSQIRARSSVTDTNWTIEMAFPHGAFAYGLYEGRDADGEKIVRIPPPDGTVYRCWFVRGIGGNGPFFNVFDSHVWNTTKTRMVFDSNAVSFQINELGPILEDIIDVHLTVKNHSNRSESVRIGFFVESADGLIYSSYESDVLTDGVLELIPGEVRELRLRQPFPGITSHGNVLWFDVRTAGSPARPIFQTRLIDFHAHDVPNFRERRVEVIETLRPPRMDFDVTFNLCPYKNRIAAVIDRGIHGASEEALGAVQARVALAEAGGAGEVQTHITPFSGEFAIAGFDLPELDEEKRYELSVLLFDKDRRIVGDYTSGNFNKWRFPRWMIEKDPSGGTMTRAWIDGMRDPATPVNEWMGNDAGLDDTVWEPFVQVEVEDSRFNTLKHEFTVGENALPAQLHIKPSDRLIPLELRDGGELPEELLLKRGRGHVFSAPMRLEAVVEGKRHESEIIEPAKLVRRGDSELEYHSQLTVGPVDVELKVQYDCDGAFHVMMDYGAEDSLEIESLEMLTDIGAAVNLLASGISGGGGMAGADIWECALPDYEGIIWDSATVERPGLYYSHFVPWIYFGSGDWGLSWMSDSDRGWGLDRDSTSMTLERNRDGSVIWRVMFVNHPFDIRGRRSIDFTIMTHPAKPRPVDYRKIAWHYRGSWAGGYGREPVDFTDEYLEGVRSSWLRENAPWPRGGRWRWHGEYPGHRISPSGDRVFEERGAYLLARHISKGGRHGWWWDESWPGGFTGSNNLASGYAYKRNPEDIIEGEEVPWQSGWTTNHMRMLHKRLARVAAAGNVPQRQYHWANAQANMMESTGWDAQLVEGAGNNHRSFDLDMRTIYPMSHYRFLSHAFTGLVVRHAGGSSPGRPGDDRRLDRQWIGPPLLHDIGGAPDSSCGAIPQVNEVLRAIDIVSEFGFFEEDAIEFIPYWRNQHIVRWGDGRKRHAPRPHLDVREPDEELYVSVYRRSFEDEHGRSGYKALFVLFNDYREDVTADLTILRPERIFGGPNTRMRSDVIEGYRADYPMLEGLLENLKTQNDVPVLFDPETGSMVELAGTEEGETYGPVHVPAKNFRLLYGHFLQ